MDATRRINDTTALFKKSVQEIAAHIATLKKRLPDIPQPERELTKNAIASIEAAIKTQDEPMLRALIKKLETFNV